MQIRKHFRGFISGKSKVFYGLNVRGSAANAGQHNNGSQITVIQLISIIGVKVLKALTASMPAFSPRTQHICNLEVIRLRKRSSIFKLFIVCDEKQAKPSSLE